MKKLLVLLTLLIPSLALGEADQYYEFRVKGCPNIEEVELTAITEDPKTGERLIIIDLDNYNKLNEYIKCIAAKARDAEKK